MQEPNATPILSDKQLYQFLRKEVDSLVKSGWFYRNKKTIENFVKDIDENQIGMIGYKQACDDIAQKLYGSYKGYARNQLTTILLTYITGVKDHPIVENYSRPKNDVIALIKLAMEKNNNVSKETVKKILNNKEKFQNIYTLLNTINKTEHDEKVKTLIARLVKAAVSLENDSSLEQEVKNIIKHIKAKAHRLSILGTVLGIISYAIGGLLAIAVFLTAGYLAFAYVTSASFIVSMLALFGGSAATVFGPMLPLAAFMPLGKLGFSYQKLPNEIKKIDACAKKIIKEIKKNVENKPNLLGPIADPALLENDQTTLTQPPVNVSPIGGQPEGGAQPNNENDEPEFDPALLTQG